MVSNQNKPLISFCIPTYKRPRQLNGALNSIVDSISNVKSKYLDFELIITDNKSDDSTGLTIKNFKEKISSTNISIKYYKQSANLGASRNLLSATNYANGVYLWFFSDDDFLMKDAVKNFISILESRDFDFYFNTRILTDKNLQKIKEINPQPNLLNGDLIFNSGIKMFEKLGIKIMSIIGFYSSIVIKKDIWEKSCLANMDETEFNYLKILLIAIKMAKCYVSSTPAVLCRLEYRGFKDEDSFVWLDHYLSAFKVAHKNGYNPQSCKIMAIYIMKSFSKTFVIDKMNGRRKGNLFGLKSSNFWFPSLYLNFWFILSLLPARWLKNFYKISRSLIIK